MLGVGRDGAALTALGGIPRPKALEQSRRVGVLRIQLEAAQERVDGEAGLPVGHVSLGEHVVVAVRVDRRRKLEALDGFGRLPEHLQVRVGDVVVLAGREVVGLRLRVAERAVLSEGGFQARYKRRWLVIPVSVVSSGRAAARPGTVAASEQLASIPTF